MSKRKNSRASACLIILIAAIALLTSQHPARSTGLGVNLAFYKINGNIATFDGNYNAGLMTTYLNEMQAARLTYVRTWVCTFLNGLTFDGSGNCTGISSQMIANVQNFAQQANSRGITVEFVFLTSGDISNHPNLLENTGNENALINNALIPLGKAIQPYRAQIDLCNEGNYSVPTVGWGYLRNWMKACKTALVNAGVDRWVTMSDASYTDMLNNFSTTFAGLGLDFYEYHMYNDQGWCPVPANLGDGKPVELNEFGSSTVAEGWNHNTYSFNSALLANFVNNSKAKGYLNIAPWCYVYDGDFQMRGNQIMNDMASWGAQLNGVTSPPAAPTGLTATAANSAVTLRWNAASGAASYNVYRGTSAGGESATPIATSLTGTTYTNSALTNGTPYYYKIIAINSAGSSGYSSEATATPTDLVTGIDLVVTSVSLIPASPAVGDHVVFSCVVRNQGQTATPTGTIVGVQFAVDGVTSPITWSDTNTTSLGPGQSVTLTANNGTSSQNYWTASSGSHSVQAWVDDVNRIAESNETNNKRTLTFSVGATVSGIDLVVQSISWTPTTLASGTHVVFSAVIKNQGQTATPAGTIVGCQFAIDGVTSPITWSDTDTTSLGPGQTVTLTANNGTNTVNYWPATSGSHTVQAWVDDVNRIAESNESNNKLTAPISVP